MPITSSGAEAQDLGPQPTDFTPSDFPYSLHYQPYVLVGTGQQFIVPTTPGNPAGLSIGAMNGTVDVVVSREDGVTLLSTTVIGALSYWISLSFPESDSYCSVNFTSTNEVIVNVTAASGNPWVAFNLYDHYISSYTASLIMYPSQFALNFGPLMVGVPVNNGISFLVVAPQFPQPVPIAIWVAEGYTDPVTGSGWYAQLGLTSVGVGFNSSHAFYETFSGTYGNIVGSGETLIPGDTYNFTMAVVSRTMWEFTVNGTAISGYQGNGFWNTTETANGGEAFAIEGFQPDCGNLAITSLIDVPDAMSLRVNRNWMEEPDLIIGSIGEGWWNNAEGEGTSPGVNFWRVEGNLENSSIPVGALEMSDSLYPVFAVPGTPGPSYAPLISFEPMYGDFSYPQVSSGGGLVNVTKISNTVLQVSPLKGTAYVSVVSYRQGDSNITSLTNAIVTSTEQISVPQGTNVAVVCAASSLLNIASQASYAQTTSEVVQMLPVVTSTTVVCSPMAVTVGSSAVCTAMVSGSSPQGDVNWSSSGPGSFTATVCALAAGQCSVGYKPSSSASPVTISASYNGDSNNSASSGTTSIVVAFAVPIVPSGIMDYLAITITNHQSSTTPVPFQQMVEVDSSTWASHEAPNLQNVEFFDAQGRVVTSWLESENNNTATNTIYWLKIADPVPAYSDITIYMGFASLTTNLFNGITVGEAPQLSPSYAQYDNGAGVFVFYDSFAGTALDANWAVNGSPEYSVHNGFSFLSSVSGEFVYSKSIFYSGSIVDSDVDDTLQNIGYVHFGGFNNPNDQSYSVFEEYGGGAIHGITSYEDGALQLATSSYGSAPLSGVFSVYTISTTSSDFQFDYASPTTLTTNRALAYPSNVLLATSGNNGAITGSLLYQWVRVRTPPPNGVMPSVTLGKMEVVTSTTVSCSTGNMTVGSSTICTALVSGEVPTGKVSWTANSTTGMFNSTTCSLTSGACSVSYTDSTPGAANVTAYYGGDSSNSGSSSGFVVALESPVPEFPGVALWFTLIASTGFAVVLERRLRATPHWI
jgi:hypothetical protein